MCFRFFAAPPSREAVGVAPPPAARGACATVGHLARARACDTQRSRNHRPPRDSILGGGRHADRRPPVEGPSGTLRTEAMSHIHVGFFRDFGSNDTVLIEGDSNGLR